MKSIRHNFQESTKKKIFKLSLFIIMGLLSQYSSCQNKESQLALKGNQLIIQKNYKEAENVFQELIKLNSNSAVGHNNLGFVYMQTKQYDKARNEFNKALKLYNDSENKSLVYNNLGMIHEKFKEFDKAENFYKKAMQLNPQYQVAYSNCAILLSEKGKVKEALSLIDKAQEVCKGLNKDLLVLRGNFAVKLKNFELAKSAYEQLKKLDPFNSGYYTYLGIIYLNIYSENNIKNDLLQKAKEVLDSAITLEDNNALAHAGLAEYFLLNNEMDNALQKVQKSLKLNPNLVYGHIVFAKILIKEKKFKAAKDIIDKGLKLDPENETILQLLNGIK